MGYLLQKNIGKAICDWIYYDCNKSYHKFFIDLSEVIKANRFDLKNVCNSYRRDFGKEVKIEVFNKLVLSIVPLIEEKYVDYIFD